MRGKVISDGSPVGTRVFTDDGHQVREVVGVSWRHEEAGQLPVLDVQIGLYEIEAEGEMRVLVGHPTDGGMREVKRIAFVDGTCWPERAPSVVRVSGVELMRSIQIKVTLMGVVRVRTWLAAKIIAFAGIVAGCQAEVTIGAATASPSTGRAEAAEEG
ncbi:hypothetical protein GG804_14100 [Sphingomonas histidinilytica]|uniref:hypothetical protein n=1 Tax=Rhizorhabdus histidinilytica TaxID=439228 RepID=UPI001ADA41B8|nr:hypothetical protein [Rhizorhabdus histidinilytica]MBO9377902.1 hypothetical protein [Rhizorhabdus histidinilytica]